jgi:FMN-dependent NADH-azoreductase
MTDPRLSPRGTKPMAGKPAYLVLARGGTYGPGTPREGWDHATEWLKLIIGTIWDLDLTVIGTIWDLDLTVIETELTIAHLNPALADLHGLAAQNRERSHTAATEHGKALAERLNEAEAA